MSQDITSCENQIAASSWNGIPANPLLRPLPNPFQERLDFETFLADLSATFVNIPADQVDSHVESGLRQIVQFLEIDRSGLGEMTPDGLAITHSYQRPGVPPSPRVILEKQFPFYAQKVHEGEAFRYPQDLPAEAEHEREFAAQTGLKSNLTIPLKVMGSIIGGIGFASFRSNRDWPGELIQRLRLVGDIMTNALARKRADQALQLATEQARALRDQLTHATRVELVNHLTTTISHEVNQPLCAMATNAQTAITLLDMGDVEEAKKALKDIWNDANRASDVIGRVRRMVKKEDPQLSPTSLLSVIEELEVILRREARAKGVEVTIDQDKMECIVVCDRVQLQQVILNLLLNAIEAVSKEDSGSAKVAIRIWEEGPAWARISVIDSGVGLSEAECERVFTPFYTTKSSGLGLGLSISRSIVVAHGGSIWATPGTCGGTAFHVQLPAVPREQP